MCRKFRWTLKCDGAPSVALSQKRYLPDRVEGSTRQTWQVPVCVRYQTGKGVEKECFLLDKPARNFKLTKAAGCPSLIAANEIASGYYISLIRETSRQDGVERAPSFWMRAEQLTLVHDLSRRWRGRAI